MPFMDLDQAPKQEIVPGYRAAFAHSRRMTLAYWEVESGAALPEHSHPHEQMASVLEGRFELTLEGESRVLEPGQAAVIPAHAPHSGKALTACRMLDVFSPVRQDYKQERY